LWEKTRALWTNHRKELFPALAVLCFFAAGLTAWFFRERPIAPAPAPAPAAAAPVPAEKETAAPAPPVEPEWVAYITGSVRHPGVYILPPGSRIFRLVEKAGGLLGPADLAAVNLAAPLEDGMHIHIPGKEERQTPVPAAPRGPARDAPARDARAQEAQARKARAAPPLAGPIDVNRATAEELTALKGIGPVLAKNIVEYRQRNGRFQSAEDLLRVKGIGPKKLENLRGSVVAGP
jgi:competence protein ComEA